MASVWVIENGEYSNYRVVGVFSNLAFVEDKRGTIAEWTLDLGINEMNAGMCKYDVTMLRDGTTPRVWQRSKSSIQIPEEQDCLTGCVWATDDKHAVKIFNEIRTRMIAEGEWE